MEFFDERLEGLWRQCNADWIVAAFGGIVLIKALTEIAAGHPDSAIGSRIVVLANRAADGKCNRLFLDLSGFSQQHMGDHVGEKGPGWRLNALKAMALKNSIQLAQYVFHPVAATTKLFEFLNQFGR
jgi:hypothetical protein